MPAPGFVENADTVPLIQALTRVADKLPTADSRRDVLTLAGIDPATLGGLRWDAVSFTFAQQLAALFKSYTPNSRQPNYHPLVSLADFLLAFPDNYGLTD